jgi:hypothetical protein
MPSFFPREWRTGNLTTAPSLKCLAPTRKDKIGTYATGSLKSVRTQTGALLG